MIGVYLDATPWAVPAFGLGSVLLLVLSGRLAGALRWSRWEVLALGVVVWGFLCVTLAPNPRFAATTPDPRVLDLDPAPVMPAQLLSLADQAALNVWIALPIGVVAACLALRTGRWWLLAAALLLPLGVELVQVALPPLGRSAFLLGDVVANWQGVVLGAVPGALVGLAARRSVRRRVPAR